MWTFGVEAVVVVIRKERERREKGARVVHWKCA